MRTSVGVGLFTGLMLLAGCLPPSGSGRVTVHLATDIRARDQLAILEVVVETAGVHAAGHPIAANWVTWQVEPHRVDLLTIRPDETLDLGASDVPAGEYDRARIVVEAGKAEGTDGSAVPLALNIEPIAIPFEMKDQEHVEITIELIALAQPDGSYHLFTKSAAIVTSNQILTVY